MSDEHSGKPIPELINALIKNVDQLPLSKQIELALPQIEKARAMGFSNAQIVRWLCSQGVPIKLNTYYVIMKRLRKKAAKKQQQPRPNALEHLANNKIRTVEISPDGDGVKDIVNRFLK